MRDLLIATTNVGKQREFKRLLAELPATLVVPADIGLDIEVDEAYDTYAQNASAKADAYCRASGLLSLADDSGLEVAALDWGPGVRTGRFGGPQVRDKVAYLLERLDGATDRHARMVCVLALGIPGDEPRIELFHGVMDGSVATEPRGSGGFGYDPIFVLPSGVVTAEMPEGDKDTISHRGRAVVEVGPRLLQLLAG